MTDINLTVPVQRRSPIYLPRRDIVLADSDSLSLLVSLVDSDDPAAPSAVLPFATATMTVWSDPWPRYWGGGYGCGWDYGRGVVGGVLWADTEPLSSGAQTTFFMPPATMSGWPLRTLWSLTVTANGASEVLATGRLHVQRVMIGTPAAAPPAGAGPLILDVDPDGHMDSQYYV